MVAYYNEIDPKAAAWLRELIARGLIAQGDVDERSIEDVRPSELAGYAQCHFFAGIGVWSYALRQAGWPDDRPVWTGSCPCQPFSAAGKGGGFDDERHLWPAFHWLIDQRRPPVVLGEQVASKDGLAWLDLVQADLEGTGYAIGAVDTCAAGFGAPHIRQRLYWVADAGSQRRQQERRGASGDEEAHGGARRNGREPHDNHLAASHGAADGLADDDDERLEGRRQSGRERAAERPAGAGGVAGGMADDECLGREVEVLNHGSRGTPSNVGQANIVGVRGTAGRGATSPTNGFWRDADWLFCRDGKWRPVEASAQPLADGIAESLGRVRDSSAAELQEEIDAWSMETQSDRGASLRALQQTLRAQAPPVWEAGRVPGLHEATFLLAFLRQLSEQGWAVEEGIALSCTQAATECLRMLRGELAASSAPRERGLERQHVLQPPDALHILSSLLARHAQAAWGDAYSAYAEVGFPLGRNSVARVPRLRGYGNAINAAQAQGFIEAYLKVA